MLLGAVYLPWIAFMGFVPGVDKLAQALLFVAAMGVPAQQILAYLGPAIGPHAFEVGPEVREAFMAQDVSAAAAFAPHANGKYLADLYLLARQRLARVGVTQVYGGGECTYSDTERFFSYRRDGATGRMAALVWIDSV